MTKRAGACGAAVLMAMTVGLGAAAPAGAATGNQTFVVVLEGDQPGRVAAGGPIAGAGQNIEDPVEESGRFVFARGSVAVDHPSDPLVIDNFNEAACAGTFQVTGTYRLHDGTGAYAGVTGSGTYITRGIERGVRSAAGCSRENSHLTFIVRFTGTTTLP